MQLYISQLISDLQNAKKNVPPDPQLGTEKTYEEFEEKMFAIETTPPQSPKKLFGVSYEELPPVEKLNETLMQQLYDAIEATFNEFSCMFDFPEDVPLALRYKLVRDIFMKDIHLMPGFTSHFDFCTACCESCEIASYCTTKDEIEIMPDDEIDYDDDSNPF